MANLLSLPSSTWASSLLPFVATSDELISLRTVCSSLFATLHEGKDADIIWKLALQRDFSFPPATGAENSTYDCMKTIRVLNLPDQRTRGTAISVFGGTASSAVFRADTAFASWKNWRKARSRVYRRTACDDDTADSDDVDNQDYTIKGPYFLRAASLWSRIERWCDSSESGIVGDRLRASLMDGLFHEEGVFSEAQYRGGASACQAIFSFYNGQKQPTDDQSIFTGLFGGYSAYDKCICTRLLPQNRGLPRQPWRNNSDAFVTLAKSFRNDKAFLLHGSTGRVYHYTPSSQIRIPAEVISAGGISETGDHSDSAMIWLEEFASRLHSGFFSIGEIVSGIPVTEGIILFPSLHSSSLQYGNGHGQDSIPPVSRAVTHGVEVIASAVYTPEFSSIGLCFMYSIRIRLLDPEDDGYVPQASRGFECCQLRERHWQIHNDSTGETDHVDGPGVIGFYPLLREGGYRADMEDAEGDDTTGTFSYQSCTGSGNSSFQGSLTFVRGHLGQPAGDFDVEVAPFALSVSPGFMF